MIPDQAGRVVEHGPQRGGVIDGFGGNCYAWCALARPGFTRLPARSGSIFAHRQRWQRSPSCRVQSASISPWLGGAGEPRSNLIDSIE